MFYSFVYCTVWIRIIYLFTVGLCFSIVFFRCSDLKTSIFFCLETTVFKCLSVQCVGYKKVIYIHSNSSVCRYLLCMHVWLVWRLVREFVFKSRCNCYAVQAFLSFHSLHLCKLSDGMPNSRSTLVSSFSICTWFLLMYFISWISNHPGFLLSWPMSMLNRPSTGFRFCQYLSTERDCCVNQPGWTTG